MHFAILRSNRLFKGVFSILFCTAGCCFRKQLLFSTAAAAQLDHHASHRLMTVCYQQLSSRPSYLLAPCLLSASSTQIVAAFQCQLSTLLVSHYSSRGDHQGNSRRRVVMGDALGLIPRSDECRSCTSRGYQAGEKLGQRQLMPVSKNASENRCVEQNVADDCSKNRDFLVERFSAPRGVLQETIKGDIGLTQKVITQREGNCSLSIRISLCQVSSHKPSLTMSLRQFASNFQLPAPFRPCRGAKVCK